MKIRLNEIPQEGQNFHYNRQTAELNSALQDLIDNNDYEVNLDIKPLNSKDFSATGTVVTKTHEQCSRCAEDFDLPISKRINEILIPSQTEDRTGKYAKTSPTVVSSEDENNVSVTEYSKQQFDMGEFIHEAVAIEVPFNPKCPICEKQGSEQPFIYDEKMSEETKQNPFEALKGLKLN